MKKPIALSISVRRRLRPAVVAVLVVVILGACGGNGTGSSPASGVAPTGTSQGFVGPPTASPEGRFGVYTMRADGSDIQQIYTGDQARNHAHVSPDGSLVVFSEFNQDLNNDGLKDESDLAASDISVMNIDGSGYRPIAHRYGFDLTPVWSPDGRSILYSSDRDNARGVLDLFVYDLDSGSLRNLTKTDNQSEGDPNWVGGRIVFNRLANGVMTLWIMDQDGKNARQLTTPSYAVASDGPYPFGDFDPKLSPDGRTVAFARHVDNGFRLGAFVIGRWDLMVVDAENGRPRVLLENGDANSMPTWSADGSSLAYWAFLRQPSGASRLFTLSSSGGTPARLTPDREDLQAQMPDWYQARSGERRIIFSAMRE
jgi:TolB protein